MSPWLATRRVLVGILFTRFEPRRLEQPAGTGGEPGAAPVLRLSGTCDVVELVEEFAYWRAACQVRALVAAARRPSRAALARGTVNAAGPDW